MFKIHNFAFKFRKVLHVNILYRSVTVGSNCKLAVFSPSVTLQPWETSEVLQDYKISRLTARLGISKILSGPKSDIRRGGSTLGDARVKVKEKKKKKGKTLFVQTQGTRCDGQADRSGVSRQTVSFPPDQKQHCDILTRAHTHVYLTGCFSRACASWGDLICTQAQFVDA